ncbi:hypothetical protein AVEN_28030-1 [Araneus ventricosus]|uniref:Uncharacterized protein n=1 Tax=Araneus ventricosus TaxID=182803 RepID=A0A4Y2BI39_ARAVE|nr:hypothetical protein AVEN_28030-1 [Araneus ventricosus]
MCGGVRCVSLAMCGGVRCVSLAMCGGVRCVSLAMCGGVRCVSLAMCGGVRCVSLAMCGGFLKQHEVFRYEPRNSESCSDDEDNSRADPPPPCKHPPTASERHLTNMIHQASDPYTLQILCGKCVTIRPAPLASNLKHEQNKIHKKQKKVPGKVKFEINSDMPEKSPR